MSYVTYLGPTAPTPVPMHGGAPGINGTGAVNSVNGKAGDVVLAAPDVGAATTAQGAKADTAVQPAGLAAVATSGAYSDLGGKPTIPAAATAAPADLATAAAAGASAKYAREDHAHKKPSPADIGAATAASALGVPVSTKTAAYTLVAGDAGSIVEVNSASAVNVTVPASIFAAGQIVEVCQIGSGQVTIVAGSGVTLRNAGGLKISAQYGSASIRFRSATEAVVAGSMTT